MRAVADESFATFAERKQDKDMDSRLAVQFYVCPIQNKVESARAGRPIFEDVECIRIFTPGDRENVVDRPIWDEPLNPHSDTVRFRQQYEAWKAGKGTEKLQGTPLSAWGVLTRSQVEELAYFKVRTVEELANVSDGNLQKLGHGYVAVRQQARDYLAVSADNAHLTRMRAELSERDNRLEVLERQMREVAEENKKLRKKADKTEG
jgi:hypothetical protein